MVSSRFGLLIKLKSLAVTTQPSFDMIGVLADCHCPKSPSVVKQLKNTDCHSSGFVSSALARCLAVFHSLIC